MKKQDWFGGGWSSFDEWVEDTIGMEPMTACTLIHIYDAIAKSAVTGAQVEQIGWTKLRAIAPVLNKENANQWVDVASNLDLKETFKLVEQLPFAEFEAAVGDSTATKVETFEWQEGQTAPMTAAILKMGMSSNAPSVSVALKYIFLDYLAGPTLQERFVGLDPKAVARTFADVLNNLDNQTAEAILCYLLDKCCF